MIRLKLLLLSRVLYSQGTRPAPLATDWDKVETSLPLTNWNRDIGPCTCDLTVGQCDANCCCDSDCGIGDIAVWFQYCAAETRPMIPYCSEFLTKVNWYGSINGSVTPAVGGGLCVVTTNNAVQGAFFNGVGTFKTDGAFTELFHQGLYINTISNYNLSNSYSTSRYTYGSAVQVRYPILGTRGNLTLPLSTNSLCSEVSTVRMMSNKRATCSRVITTAAASCASGTPLDINYYTRGFNYIMDPESGSNVPSVTFTYSCLDSSTGAVIPGAALGACPLTPTRTPVLTGASCSQMVAGVDITFQYKSASILSIESVKVVVWVTTRTLNANMQIPQTFSVNFVQEGVAVVYKKSGNPGYIVGSPVLAGSLVRNNQKNAVSYIPDPMFGISMLKDVPVAGGAGPVGCTSGVTDYYSRTPITFGENTKTGCTLWLRNSDLAAANCNNLRKRIFELQTLTASQVDMIGIFGNSSATKELSEWVKVINTVPDSLTGSGIGNTDVTDGFCTNLLINFGIEFLYTVYGSNINPQYAIVGARYNYTGGGSIGWQCKKKRDCIDPAVYTGAPEFRANIGTNQQAFLLRSSVSFVRVNTVGTSLYSPPPPRIWATLPDDVWYPFYIPVPETPK